MSFSVSFLWSRIHATQFRFLNIRLFREISSITFINKRFKYSITKSNFSHKDLTVSYSKIDLKVFFELVFPFNYDFSRYRNYRISSIHFKHFILLNEGNKYCESEQCEATQKSAILRFHSKLNVKFQNI
jgi:hypothetical protein